MSKNFSRWGGGGLPTQRDIAYFFSATPLIQRSHRNIISARIWVVQMDRGFRHRWYRLSKWTEYCLELALSDLFILHLNYFNLYLNKCRKLTGFRISISQSRGWAMFLLSTFSLQFLLCLCRTWTIVSNQYTATNKPSLQLQAFTTMLILWKVLLPGISLQPQNVKKCSVYYGLIQDYEQYSPLLSFSLSTLTCFINLSTSISSLKSHNYVIPLFSTSITGFHSLIISKRCGLWTFWCGITDKFGNEHECRQELYFHKWVSSVAGQGRRRDTIR